ncbi:MAG TPA: ACT domain-containing protein [Egibacteraceae bacterium]|nr:ACT domain-containing protein [Egibacteraceae bacterium]
MRLLTWPEEYRIVRLQAGAAVPEWAVGPWSSVTRTPAELSLVCLAAGVPPDVQSSGPWRLLEVEGPLDLALTGVMAALAVPLAAAGVSLFPSATFDTDYLLVRSGDLHRAASALREAGHAVSDRPDDLG